MNMENVKMVNGVCTITDISRTEELKEFYNYVVENNIEKYMAVAKNNQKFMYDEAQKVARPVPQNTEYNVNPKYRKIEVADVEKLVADAQAVAEKDEPEVAEESVQTEQETPETQKTDTAEQTMIESLTLQVEEYKSQILMLKDSSRVDKERADVAEAQLAVNAQRIHELEDKIAETVDLTQKYEQLKAEKDEICEKYDKLFAEKVELLQEQCTACAEVTDKYDEFVALIEKLNDLGFEVTLRKI